MDDILPVQYRDIPGFPGYRVGNDGTVWSCLVKRRRTRGRGFASAPSITWKQLRPMFRGRYYHVSLFRDRKRTSRAVHFLVLETFVGPRPDGMVCRHFPDRNTGNNRIENLSWGTHKENAADRVVHGTDLRGERVGNAILTAPQVVEMRTKYAAIKGDRRVLPAGTLARLAVEYGVSRAAVIRIVYRSSWQHC